MQHSGFDDLHCSLGDGRSFTDPVTNWVLISGPQIDHHLSNMIQIGKYPKRYLPDFIHEFAHHWCFHSPVGTTLAMLQMRACRKAILLLDREVSEKDAFAVAEDFVRYETAITLMRPLAEGLALFAEFDAAPGDSSVLSMASLAAAVGFLDEADGEHENESPEQSWNAFAQFLLKNRLTDDIRDRKANLLVQPFTTQNGGYLPGYLMVKNIRRALLNQMEGRKFADSDLFFTYLRSFFYEDYGFVAMLLDPDIKIDPWENTNDSAEALSSYFQRRFAQLFQCTNDEEVERFERLVSSNQEFDWPPPPGSAEGLHDKGRQRFQQMLEELNFDGEPDSPEEMLRRTDQWLLAQRDLMCIASLPSLVEINEHGRVLVGHYQGSGSFHAPLYSGPALEGTATGKGNGSLEFFLSVTERYMVSTVTLNNQVVAVNSLSPNFNEVLRRQITGYWTSQEEAAKLRAAKIAAVERALDEPTIKVYMEHYRENSARVAELHYGAKALLFTPDSHLDHCLTRLRSNGFYEALDSDEDLIRAVAHLSLAASAVSDRESIADWLEEQGIDLDSILERLDLFWKEYQLPLIVAHNDFIWSFI